MNASSAKPGSARIERVVLEGPSVRLEPMTLEHHGELSQVGCDPELWRFTASVVRTPAEMLDYMLAAQKMESEGTGLPFVTIERSTGKVVGSTRFRNYDSTNGHVEIGFTWLAAPWQRTAINTETKYLMLTHAFETLGCARVELRTHAMNTRSRNAILRLGATEEAVLRKDTMMWNGQHRDTVYYSILDEEWSRVKQRLELLMASYR